MGEVAPCLTGGNILYLFGDGNDWVHPGPDLISDASWPAELDFDGSRFNLSMTPADEIHGSHWLFGLSAADGAELTTGVYEDAERLSFASPGHPGLDVSGDGRACNTLSGRFQVHDIAASAGKLQSVTASFEQECSAGNVLRGCLHWSVP